MRYLVSILSLVAVLVTLASVKASQIFKLISAGETFQKAGPRPEVVSTTRAQRQTWEGTLNAVGTIVAARGVALSNDVPGIVSQLHFDSGATVQRGQVLVELDAKVERAQLDSVRARRDLAEMSLKRTRALVTTGAIAPAQLDNDESTYRSLAADASALEAQIAKKSIRAPFSGRLGLRSVNLGQYLAPGTLIAALESMQTVYVDFTLPQQELGKLRTRMPVRVSDASHGGSLAEGVVSAIAPEVDTLTRDVKVRASIANPGEKLHPGMFVQVAVVLPEKQNVLVVPATAIVHATYGDSVFIAEKPSGAAATAQPTRVARQQFVRAGEMRGDFVSVVDGINLGEEVVTAGAFKLRNGAPLLANNNVKLAPQVTPHTDNR
jgi:membrane fusion protein, multidrug efflux system